MNSLLIVWKLISEQRSNDSQCFSKRGEAFCLIGWREVWFVTGGFGVNEEFRQKTCCVILGTLEALIQVC